MRPLIAILLACTLTIGAAALTPLAAGIGTTVSLSLVDAATGKSIPGVIRISKDGDTFISLPPLVNRGQGLDQASPIAQWSTVVEPVSLELPRSKVMIEAVSGIETELQTMEVDLSAGQISDIKVPLRHFSRLRDHGWHAANTHLHLNRLSRAAADRYVREIPAGDRLDILFLSYLERDGDDRHYITNEYPVGRLRELESRNVQISNGEEHRHNFGPQGEGYGHVMLLGIKQLVQPVSIGFGISKKHPDWPPIRAGIDEAHSQGGTAIWCHNNWGFEDVPNWLTGRLDAQNIFDGGSHGSYEDSFYRYLNAGLKVPFSTGTDWFMYDFSRCIAQVEGELTAESWLAALRSGRTFITNGPILELQVNAVEPGGTIELAQPGELRVEATARGRLDFGRLEIVQNGRVIESAPARANEKHYLAQLDMRISASEPCWLAARTTTSAKNEYGRTLFAHTSAVYITISGRTTSREEDVRHLLSQVESARSAIEARARFDRDQQQAEILQIYEQAAQELRRRLPETSASDSR